MRYLSVCSGIEAATAAWHPLGWKPVAFSEVDPFACAVLKHHYPNVPNLGDMTKIDGKAFRGKVDVLVGGTPCQAFSVAGLRKGLEDARGNLTVVFAKLANEIQPDWIVWENVPGVLSDKTNAFGCLLGALSGEGDPLIPPGGRWTDAGHVAGPERSIAWRVLDAQYFGLAQRRRRVFVVACPRGGADPGEVLFEPESVCGHPKKSREERQGFTGDSKGCPGVSGKRVDTYLGGDVICGLDANYCKGPGSRGVAERPVVVQAYGGNNCSGPINVAAALNAKSTMRQDFETESLIDYKANPAISFHSRQDPIAQNECSLPLEAKGGQSVCVPSRLKDFKAKASFEFPSHDETDEVTPTLQAENGLAVCYGFSAGQSANAGTIGYQPEQSPTLRGAASGTNQVPAVCFQQNTRDEVRKVGGDGQITGALSAQAGMKQQNYIAQGFQTSQSGVRLTETHATLDANNGSRRHNGVITGMAVRRLLPLECERLQGFPDNYTQIPWRGKPAAECPDGPRYRALGNSMAVPCMRWIGRRIGICSRKS